MPKRMIENQIENKKWLQLALDQMAQMRERAAAAKEPEKPEPATELASEIDL